MCCITQSFVVLINESNAPCPQYFLGSVDHLASAPVKTTVNNIRAFEDGDKVFLQTVYNFASAGEQVAFDIFRFDSNGKIAEHWDVMETIADESTWQNQNGKF